MAELFTIPNRLWANDTDTVIAPSAAEAAGLSVALMGIGADEDGYHAEDYTPIDPGAKWTLIVEDEDGVRSTARELADVGVSPRDLSVTLTVDTFGLIGQGVVRGLFRIETTASNWARLTPRFLGSTEW